tara:strand:- start:8 stop:2023 length:2016 start_codon:yes stop_codon:yes gene_type:complete
MKPKKQIDFLVEDFFNTGKLYLNKDEEGITFDQLELLVEQDDNEEDTIDLSPYLEGEKPVKTIVKKEDVRNSIRKIINSEEGRKIILGNSFTLFDSTPLKTPLGQIISKLIEIKLLKQNDVPAGSAIKQKLFSKKGKSPLHEVTTNPITQFYREWKYAAEAYNDGNYEEAIENNERALGIFETLSDDQQRNIEEKSGLVREKINDYIENAQRRLDNQGAEAEARAAAEEARNIEAQYREKYKEAVESFKKGNYEDSIIQNKTALNLYSQLTDETKRNFKDKYRYWGDQNIRYWIRKAHEHLKSIADHLGWYEIKYPEIISQIQDAQTEEDEEEIKQQFWEQFLNLLQIQLIEDGGAAYGKWIIEEYTIESDGSIENIKGKRYITSKSNDIESFLNNILHIDEINLNWDEIIFKEESEATRYEGSFDQSCDKSGESFLVTGKGDRSRLMKRYDYVKFLGELIDAQLLLTNTDENKVKNIVKKIVAAGFTPNGVKKYDLIALTDVTVNPHTHADSSLIIIGDGSEKSSKIEVKDVPYNRVDGFHLSEFFGLYKHTNIEQRSLEQDRVNLYEKVIEALVDYMNDNPIGKTIIDHLDKTMTGIFFSDYIYLPQSSYTLSWSSDSRGGEKRLTIRVNYNEGDPTYEWIEGNCNIDSQSTNESTNHLDDYISEALGF